MIYECAARFRLTVRLIRMKSFSCLSTFSFRWVEREACWDLKLTTSAVNIITLVSQIFFLRLKRKSSSQTCALNFHTSLDALKWVNCFVISSKKHFLNIQSLSISSLDISLLDENVDSNAAADMIRIRSDAVEYALKYLNSISMLFRLKLRLRMK